VEGIRYGLYFKEKSKYLREGTEKSHNKFNQSGLSPDSDLNLRTPDYKEKVTATQP
jgi:hypothetical protein